MEFTVAGREFAVAMPMQPAGGAGAFLPWIILAVFPHRGR
jgi:hypothetical protein